MKFIFPHQFSKLTTKEKFQVMREIAKGSCKFVYTKYEAMQIILEVVNGE